MRARERQGTTLPTVPQVPEFAREGPLFVSPDRRPHLPSSVRAIGATYARSIINEDLRRRLKDGARSGARALTIDLMEEISGTPVPYASECEHSIRQARRTQTRVRRSPNRGQKAVEILS